MFFPKILIVDDEKNTREGLKTFLEMHDYEVSTAKDPYDGIEEIKEERPDIVLSDLRMPGMDGIEFLKRIKKIDAKIYVIVMTAYGTIDNAVEAIKEGAYDYISKPLNMDELLATLKKAVKHKKLELENKELKTELKKRDEFGEIIYASDKMKNIISIVKQVAPSDASVLIEGESGTGKELIARMIHAYSRRKNGSFIPVHCAALTDTLLLSELFGHEKGAFTGATERKLGRFERAHNGTIFLDEIAEIKEDAQVKLLRVLQEGEFERVGGDKTVKVDVRLVSATNKNLLEEIKKKNFREDLYYRINVVTINIPPLRERKDDIEPLVNYYLNKLAAANNKNIKGITKKALSYLIAYDWPGNVRELKNVVERMVVLADGDKIDEDNIPADIKTHYRKQPFGTDISFDGTLADVEREYIAKVLSDAGGNKVKAAKRLGISRRTLYRKMSEYGLE